MELFYEFKIAKDERSNSILMGDAFKSSLKEFSQRLTDEQKKEAYSIVDSYLQKLAKEGESDYDVLSVEKKFAVNINDTVVLNGMIDRIDIDKDGVISVLDYKSTKNKKYLKDEFFQLLTYAYVLWTEDPTITRVRGAYILLRHNFERIEKEFSLAEIMEVKNKYEDYAKRIESEQLFQANPTRMCTYCDHLALCAEGKEFTNPLIKSGDNKWV
jgi:RecB family exonuclease